MTEISIRILDTPEDIGAVEAIQREVWPGSETEIVPSHVLLTAAHNGGLVLGAYIDGDMVGILFGFPGLEFVPDGPRPKHCSHMLGVLPAYRDAGVGYALKRAQWQIVRHQGLDHVTWTYDPLLSRNAYLNIARLGAVCNTYRRSEYGDMRDGLNVGLASDRFQVDWWINTKRVQKRLSKRPRKLFNLQHFEQASSQRLYATSPTETGWLQVPSGFTSPQERIALVEIPPDFTALKEADFALARDWRQFSREVFEKSFELGYLVTDFVFDRSSNRPRSFYVLLDGESTLDRPDGITLF